ncbi:MAG: ferrous iron transport protein B [bacterium]|nr:ferrous iron transport protein B [bacterium]
MNRIIALAGNPNVGKSTVFNALTGMHQHTGNWPGKTVSNAYGFFNYKQNNYKIYDLPGIYSIFAHSEEEYVARDFICFEDNDITIVVCDAVCLMRNLNLVLQICEIKDNVIVCVNLLDEAIKKKIYVNIHELSKLLNVKVIGMSARNNVGIDKLLDTIDKYSNIEKSFKVKYNEEIENAIIIIQDNLKKKKLKLPLRWVSLNLLKNDEELKSKIIKYENLDKYEVEHLIIKARKKINNIEMLEEEIVETINDKAEEISKKVVIYKDKNYLRKDKKIDKLLTNKLTGIPMMLLLFGFIFWLTIVGSNYPSEILQKVFFSFENKIYLFLNSIKIPLFINEMLVHGIYRVLAWVVSVMLPPMSIFFPLFTLLEDIGYLPRIAFNVDGIFKRCNACGKQALTMAMGFGCNSVGVSGCRIIDSPRERLIAILTNTFVPCNGRFPILISIISMFFIGSSSGLLTSIKSVVLLLLIVLLGIIMSLFVSKILSKTLLKGIPSSFTLELPPYRIPQVGKVIIRSIFDRTLFVLGRAISVAIPAGLIIWLMANVNINGSSILSLTSNFLNPFGKMIGMDGTIILAFILGFPANEIVIPIIIMSYMASGNLIEITNLNVLKNLLINNGWTWLTAVSVMIFTLMHFPCSTTCLTIKKETKSIKWTLLAFIIPTICGIIICAMINLIFNVF